MAKSGRSERTRPRPLQLRHEHWRECFHYWVLRYARFTLRSMHHSRRSGKIIEKIYLDANYLLKEGHLLKPDIFNHYSVLLIGMFLGIASIAAITLPSKSSV